MTTLSTGQIYRDFFASISEISADLLYVKDKERRLVHAGQTYQDIFGRDLDALRGKRTEDLWPDQAETVIPDEERALEGERITDVERPITHPDGSEHWYSVNKIPKYDEENNVIGFLGIDRDITERKQRERELDRTRSQFQELTENAHLGVLSVNDKGIIRYANEGLGSILGHEPADLVDEPLTRIIPNRLREDNESGFLRYLRTGTRQFDWDWVQVPGLASNGDEIPLGISFG
ncbi:MAG: PAS domain-containing protein, partial [Halobacteriaceae archaeon]